MYAPQQHVTQRKHVLAVELDVRAFDVRLGLRLKVGIKGL